MEEELSTDAIGIPSTPEPGDVPRQDETSNTPATSESGITLTSHETGLSSEQMASEQYRETMNVFEQLNDKRKELEQLNVKHLQCLEELKHVKLQLERTENVNCELTTTCSMLQKMQMTSNVTDATLDGFQSLMHEATDKGQDMGLIKRLINSNTEITAAYHLSVNEIKREELALKSKERKIHDEMLLRELSLNLKSANEILHTKYSQHTLDTKLNLNVDATKILCEVSKTLNAEEREKLMKQITWSENDVVKACIDADTSLLLLGLECKQAEQTKNRVGTAQFLTAYGKEISKDLLEMYNQLTEQQKKMDEDEKRRKLYLQLTQLLTSKSKSPEEIVLSYAEQLNFKGTMSVNNTLQSVTATFVVKLMTQKSKGLILFLNEEECTRLFNTCTWYDQDVIKECIEEDRRLLLPGVLCKEMEKVGTIIAPEAVVKRLQEETNRHDLLVLFRQLKTDEKELQAQIDLWHERQKMESQLLQMLSSGQTSAEEFLFQKLTKFTLKLAGDIETAPHFARFIKLFGEYSGQVTKKEQAELIDLYKWDKNDAIRACINADEKLLFEGLWCKDMDLKQIVIPMDTYMSSICQKIKRTDLAGQFKEDIQFISVEKFLHHAINKSEEYFKHLDASKV